MKIIIRCDGASLPEIGTGHVSRMVFLAKSLIQNNLCDLEEIFFYPNVKVPFLLVTASYKRQD